MNDKPNTDLTAEATAKGIAQLVHRPNECTNCGLAHGTHTYNCPRAAVPAVSETREEPTPLMVDGFARSHRVDLWTAAEQAIAHAVNVCETTLPADPLETDAIILLGNARAKVAQLVDREILAGRMAMPGLAASPSVGREDGAREPGTGPDWTCAHCQSVNFDLRTRCRICKKPRESAPAPSSAGTPAGVPDWICDWSYDAVGEVEHRLERPTQHRRNCGGDRIDDGGRCSCGLTQRQLAWDLYSHLQTERTMHAAWRKRAEEAEAARSAPTPAPSAGSDQTDAVRLVEIDARANAAQPGPWTADVSEPHDLVVWGKHRVTLIRNGSEFLDVTPLVMNITDESIVRIGDCCGDPADAHFIAHAREDVPWLVSEVRRLTAALSEAETERCVFGCAKRHEAALAEAHARAEELFDALLTARRDARTALTAKDAELARLRDVQSAIHDVVTNRFAHRTGDPLWDAVYAHVAHVSAARSPATPSGEHNPASVSEGPHDA